MPTIAESLVAATARLAPSGPEARLEAELLLGHCLERPRTWLFTWPDRELGPEQAAAFEALVARRAAGEPVAYLTGERGFWSLSLHVGPGVLIPRPETELLVELALVRIPAAVEWRVADLGTGSGAIACAVAVERPACRVVAVERSAAALSIAERNVRELGLAGQVRLMQGDWCAPLRALGRFDLLLSNPPYVAEADPHLGQGDLRHEPITALASGPDGLDDIRRLAREGREVLRAEGWMLLEHGYDQGPAVRAILERAGWREARTHADLGGRDRVTEARLG